MQSRSGPPRTSILVLAISPLGAGNLHCGPALVSEKEGNMNSLSNRNSYHLLRAIRSMTLYRGIEVVE